MIKREQESELKRVLALMGYADLVNNQRIINAIRDVVNYENQEATR